MIHIKSHKSVFTSEDDLRLWRVRKGGIRSFFDIKKGHNPFLEKKEAKSFFGEKKGVKHFLGRRRAKTFLLVQDSQNLP